MEDNKSYRNPLLYASYGTIGCPAPLSGQLPSMGIQRNWQMLFKLLDYLEFDSIKERARVVIPVFSLRIVLYSHPQLSRNELRQQRVTQGGERTRFV